MKTVQEYMNDPRITGDPGLMKGPEEIRTIHAIRLKQQDETIDENAVLSSFPLSVSEVCGYSSWLSKRIWV
jgi:hypothetical protein